MIQHAQKLKLKNEVKMNQTGFENKLWFFRSPGLGSFILTIYFNGCECWKSYLKNHQRENMLLYFLMKFIIINGEHDAIFSHNFSDLHFVFPAFGQISLSVSYPSFMQWLAKS